MSTRTSNLQLHLWAEDDYVLMSDFNADHAAIDAYVTTAANDAAAMKQELLEGQQRSNLNLFRLLILRTNHRVADPDFTGRHFWRRAGDG